MSAVRAKSRFLPAGLLIGLALSCGPLPAAALNACDLNGDGVVDKADIQAAINMALGIGPCQAAIAGTGVCDILVVQRVIEASLGGSCLTSSGLHVVELHWKPSDSPGVTGYRVYRRTDTASFKLIATPGNVTTYVDATVVSGTTYRYAVSALSSQGESALSLPVSAAIPTP